MIHAAVACRSVQNYFELCYKPAAEEWASVPRLRLGLSNSELCLSSASGLVWFSTLKMPVLPMSPVSLYDDWLLFFKG